MVYTIPTYNEWSTPDYYNEVTTTENQGGDKWKKVITKEKKKWPSMTSTEAHAKWGHPHNDQLNKTGNFIKWD